jgi:EpsI family protein
MKKFRNRYFTLVLILTVNSVLINFLSYDKYNDAQAGIQAIEKIPQNIGKWRGYDIPVEDLIFEILETKSIIHRNYVSNKSNVFLSLVYYPQTKVDFHAPESCLAGQGVNISKSVNDIFINEGGQRIKIIVNRLIRQNNDTDELLYYFYKAGDFIGPSYIKLRLALAMNKLSTKEKSGSLIRVSTPIESNNVEYAQAILKEFIEALYPFIIKAI